MRTIRACLLMMLMAWAGCGKTTANSCTTDVSDYDQSCTSAMDCVSVPSGNLCAAACTNCPSAAINKNAQAAYQSALSKLDYTKRDCPCSNSFVFCNQGQCAVIGNQP